MTDTIEDFRLFKFDFLKLDGYCIEVKYTSLKTIKDIPFTNVNIARYGYGNKITQVITSLSGEYSSVFRDKRGCVNLYIKEILSNNTYVLPMCSFHPCHIWISDHVMGTNINLKHVHDIAFRSLDVIQTIDEYNMTKALM